MSEYAGVRFKNYLGTFKQKNEFKLNSANVRTLVQELKLEAAAKLIGSLFKLFGSYAQQARLSRVLTFFGQQ